MKKTLKNIGLWFVRALVLGGCGIISVFLLASGYESVYSRSLPFVHAIDPVNMQAYGTSYTLSGDTFGDEKLYGSYGRPTNVKLPERNARLDIVSPIQYHGEWLARATALHMLLPAEPRNGNIGVALLYCRSSFRTINDQNLPAVGSNIFMDTDKDWRYVYKVTSAKVYADSIPYIASDTGRTSKLIITCNDQAGGANVVVEATLLSVQGVEQ